MSQDVIAYYDCPKCKEIQSVQHIINYSSDVLTYISCKPCKKCYYQSSIKELTCEFHP